MKLYKKIYENSIDDFFDNESFDNEEPYYEGSYDYIIKDQIDKWLKDNCIINGSYEILEDLSINVNGHVEIDNEELKEFPNYINFNEVLGNFDYNYCKIESLKGGPKKVGGNFYCSYCDLLKTLEGGPEYVEGKYSCHTCLDLISLKGAPKYVGGDFYCSYCSSLESLEDCPEYIKGNFKCSYCNKLPSLKGGPKKVEGYFSCTNCHSLKSLEGCPEYVGYNFYCSYCNSLESLEGAPKYIEGDFLCFTQNKSFNINDLPSTTILKGEFQN